MWFPHRQHTERLRQVRELITYAIWWHLRDSHRLLACQIDSIKPPHWRCLPFGLHSAPIFFNFQIRPWQECKHEKVFRFFFSSSRVNDTRKARRKTQNLARFDKKIHQKVFRNGTKIYIQIRILWSRRGSTSKSTIINKTRGRDKPSSRNIWILISFFSLLAWKVF